jgi:hypothetical protein
MMKRLVFVVSVKLLADYTAVVIAASSAEAVGKFNDATMRAGSAAAKDSFPVGTAGSLTGMALTLLGNWHGEIPLY